MLVTIITNCRVHAVTVGLGIKYLYAKVDELISAVMKEQQKAPARDILHIVDGYAGSITGYSNSTEEELGLCVIKCFAYTCAC